MVGAAVHTTGINWEGVIAVAASVCTILGVAGWPLAKMAMRSLHESQAATTRDVVNKELGPRFDRLEDRLENVDRRLDNLERQDSQLDRRVSFLEGVETGRNAQWMEHLSGRRREEGDT